MTDGLLVNMHQKASALGLVGYNASGADGAQQARPVTEGLCLLKVKEKVKLYKYTNVKIQLYNLKACLGPELFTVLPKGAPFGTPLVTVFDRGGPPLAFR